VRSSLLVVLVVAGGCSAVHVLTRPEGDGGWTASERREQLSARAQSAEVSLDATPLEAERSETLTLDDVMRLAAANRRVIEADRSVDIARAGVDQARGRFFPNVTGRGRYDWFTDSQTVEIDLPPGLLLPGTALPTAVIRERDFFSVNGTATAPIDVFGELTKNLTSAQAGYRAEEARRAGVLLGEQVAATRSYFGLLEAQRLIEVARQTLDSQRQQLRNAQARVDQGRLTRNELLVVQVAVRNTEQELLQLELRERRARWNLNQLIGRPIDAPLELADVVTPPALPPADAALREAFATNVTLRILVEEQQRLQDAASSLARGRLPRFHGGGTIDYSTQEIIQPQRIGGGFVGFTWDVLDAPRDAEIAKARIAIEQNRTRIERTLREVEAAVRATHGAAEERLAALATAETAVVQAEENRRIRAQQFDVGRATSEDLLDAETLLARQRAALATSRYQAHVRAAELEELIGRPLESFASQSR
jgi:outer membrane protein TolC